MNSLSRRALLLVAALASGQPMVASAQADFPNRPVKIVVPFGPGNGMDLVARTLGRELERRWGQSVVVENRAGAAGNLGTGVVAKSKPDGYTLLVHIDTIVINPGIYRDLGWDPIKDFTPLALAARADTPITLVGANAMPAKSLAEVLALAKAQPGKLNFASPGVGTPQHLAMEMLAQKTGIKLVHVPFRTTVDAVSQLVAGDVQLMFAPGHVALQQAKAGRFRIIAVDGTQRWPEVPDAPTFMEGGVPDMDLTPWYGVFAPRGLPDDIAARLKRDLAAAMKEPAVRTALLAGGLRALSGDAQELAQLMTRDQARWGALTRALKITAD